MIILTIRTDKPEAEIGLYDTDTRLDYVVWQAHRALAETLHQQIMALLSRHDKQLADITGVVCYKGPGSFTGLRIGLTVANALTYSTGAALVAEGGEDWLRTGVSRLKSGAYDPIALPEYGAPVRITTQKK